MIALLEIGPQFGYLLETTKLCLITKSETHALGKEISENAKVKIKNSGKRYLGLIIGTVPCEKQYADEIVSQWIPEIEVLSQIVETKPQAAYCCFRTGFKHKVTISV